MTQVAVKPYAVIVTIGGKQSGKEFSTKAEMDSFIEKAEELKRTKAPTMEIKIVRKPPVVSFRHTQVTIDPKREESPAWEVIIENGVRKGDFRGNQMYRSVPVSQKKGVLYCPYCCSYKNFKKKDTGYGNTLTICPDCEISDLDFHVKTVNNLWKMKG